jgi:hypothetical protein
MPETGISRRDYDLTIKFSDGVHVRAEAKCKLEESPITIRSLDQTLSKAKSQLPKRAPGIIFVKIPRSWIEDAAFTEQIKKRAHIHMDRTRNIVSIKFFISNVVRDPANNMIGEMVAFDERANLNHCFSKYKKMKRGFHMFPAGGCSCPAVRLRRPQRRRGAFLEIGPAPKIGNPGALSALVLTQCYHGKKKGLGSNP